MLYDDDDALMNNILSLHLYNSIITSFIYISLIILLIRILLFVGLLVRLFGIKESLS